MWDPYSEFETTTLSNGLTIHAAQWPGRPWETLGFLVHSGAEQDPVGFEGTAHYVEHLIGENAPMEKQRVKDFFGQYGGAVEFGKTGWYSTEYKFWIPTDPDIVCQALSIFGPALLSARLTRSVEHQKKVITREFRQYFPHDMLFELDMREHRALYQGYWLSRSVRPLGYPEALARITVDELQSYYDAHYVPRNMSVVAVGGLTLAELVGYFSNSPFAVEKPGLRIPLPVPATDIAPPRETRYVFKLSEHVSTKVPFENASYRSVAALPTGRPTWAVTILQDMLNEMLYGEVRGKRGATYHLGSSFSNARHFYEFVISSGSLQSEMLAEAEAAIESSIATLGDQEDLFAKVRQAVSMRQGMIDPNARGLCDDAINDIIHHERIRCLDEERREVQSLTFDDVRCLLPWLRPERRWTMISEP